MISSGVQGDAFSPSGSECKLCFLGGRNSSVPGESVVSLPQVACQGLDATRVASATYGLPSARNRERILDILRSTCTLGGLASCSPLLSLFLLSYI